MDYKQGNSNKDHGRINQLSVSTLVKACKNLGTGLTGEINPNVNANKFPQGIQLKQIFLQRRRGGEPYKYSRNSCSCRYKPPKENNFQYKSSPERNFNHQHSEYYRPSSYEAQTNKIKPHVVNFTSKATEVDNRRSGRPGIGGAITSDREYIPGGYLSPGSSAYSHDSRLFSPKRGIWNRSKYGIKTVEGKVLLDAEIDPNGSVYSPTGVRVGFVRNDGRVVTIPKLHLNSSQDLVFGQDLQDESDVDYGQKGPMTTWLETKTVKVYQSHTNLKQNSYDSSSDDHIKKKKEPSIDTLDELGAAMDLGVFGRKWVDHTPTKKKKKSVKEPTPEPTPIPTPVSSESSSEREDPLPIDPRMWRSHTFYDFLAHMGRGLTLDEIILAGLSSSSRDPPLPDFLNIDKNLQEDNWRNYGAHDDEITATGLLEGIYHALNGPTIEQTILSLGAAICKQCFLGTETKLPLYDVNREIPQTPQLSYSASTVVASPFEHERLYEQVAQQLQASPEVRKYMDRYYAFPTKRRISSRRSSIISMDSEDNNLFMDISPPQMISFATSSSPSDYETQTKIQRNISFKTSPGTTDDESSIISVQPSCKGTDDEISTVSVQPSYATAQASVQSFTSSTKHRPSLRQFLTRKLVGADTHLAKRSSFSQDVPYPVHEEEKKDDERTISSVDDDDNPSFSPPISRVPFKPSDCRIKREKAPSCLKGYNPQMHVVSEEEDVRELGSTFRLSDVDWAESPTFEEYARKHRLY